MKEETADTEEIKEKKIEHKVAVSATFVNTWGGMTNWSPDEVDKLDVEDINKFWDIINECRFYYKRDPIASTVLNKLVEIAIDDLQLEQKQLSDNEFRLFEQILPTLLNFIEKCALEWLISGLVIPEIKYNLINEDEVKKLGIKKKSTLELPTKMWVRDPTTVRIKSPLIGGEVSYFVVLPEELITFIQNEGDYGDGTSDVDLYNEIMKDYPEFVDAVKEGNKEILLKNDLVVRRKVISGTELPIPYLYSALESLKHKRNLRRMDYAIAARVIGAIQLFRLGDKEYPITEDDQDAFDDIRQQMTWRNTDGKDIEKIFQLFANHTLQIDWIMPDASALLDEQKYSQINQDIFFSLGFPRILTTGETERSQASNPEFAVISPTKTMENMQEKLIIILKDIVYNISKRNEFKGVPEISFGRINLNKLDDFTTAWVQLYETGNLSRDTFVGAFGYDFEEEINRRKEEEDYMEELGVPSFAPVPYSNQPDSPNSDPNKQKDSPKKTDKTDK
jgi:hypothetical protein